MADDEISSAKRHGGSRPGAGRKAKGLRSPSALSDLDIKAAQAAPVPSDIETVAQTHAKAALQSLVKVMVGGAGDQARVKAATAVLDRAFGKPSPDAGGSAPDLFFSGVRSSMAVVDAIRAEARAQAMLAVEVLARISMASESEGSRVSASRALLDRGCGAVAAARVPDEMVRQPLGKREQHQADAKAAAQGIYEVPEAPETPGTNKSDTLQ